MKSPELETIIQVVRDSYKDGYNQAIKEALAILNTRPITAREEIMNLWKDEE